MNVNKAAIITDDIIKIECHKFGHYFSTDHEELLLDIFCTYYNGQQIEIIADDGENIEHRGIITFFENLCKLGIVARSSITFMSSHNKWNHNFLHKKTNLIIFSQTKQYLNGDSLVTESDAKFVGCLIARFSPNRFNLAYQLDNAFPKDNFLIFRPSVSEVKNFYSKIDGGYQRELDWFAAKKFDKDELLELRGNGTGFLGWQQSTATYHTLWPRFQIECVAETDVFSNSWFTEKTARCLVSGKPFVLFSAPGSLQTLRNFGFRTFGSVIDESYDNQLTPRARLTAMIQTLTDLYNSADRQQKINQLNEVAKYNQSIFDKCCF